jgi:hypothetical protein
VQLSAQRDVLRVASQNSGAVNAALVSRCAAEIPPEKIEWLWPGRLAAVTTAGQWPCGEGQAPVGNAIILSAEDGGF